MIPTAVVGSHGKPGWWFASVKALEHGDFGPADLEEMFDDAANAAMRFTSRGPSTPPTSRHRGRGGR